MSETDLNSTEMWSPLNTFNMCTTFRVMLSQFVLQGVIPPTINSILSNELNYHYRAITINKPTMICESNYYFIIICIVL